MYYRRFLLLACAGFVSAVSVENVSGAERTIVVRSSKMEERLYDQTQSVTVITEDQLKEKNYTDFTEILRREAGLEFKQAGGPGQFNHPKMRGFASGNMLVVIDGIKVNEAGSGDVGNLLGQLDSSLIERIEILRGPQATLYGANSTAGVIAITTKSGAVDHAGVSAEAGSLGWRKGALSYRDNLRLAQGDFRYSVNASNTDSDGVHPQEFFKDETQQLKLTYLIDTLEMGMSVLHTDNSFQFAELDEAYVVSSWDQYWSFQTTDPNNTRDTENTLAGVYIKQDINDSLSQRLQLGGIKKVESFLDLDDGLLGYAEAPFDSFSFDGLSYARGAAVPIYDSKNPLSLSSDYENNNRQIDYNLNYHHAAFKGLFGLERLAQRSKQDSRYGSLRGDETVTSAYLNGEIALLQERLVVSLGVRTDDYDTWGRESTGKTGVAFHISKDSTVFANYGTSFKAPTLSQLFNPSYGNLELQPESGHTIESGFRQYLLGERLLWSATVWRSELDEVIIYDYTVPNPRTSFGFGQYANAQEQRTQGVELDSTYYLNERFWVTANYTYTDSHFEKDGQWERTVQIARNKANLGVSYQVDKITLGSNLYYTGPRLRWAGDLETDAYRRLDVSARIDVTKALTAYTRIENLFDKTYEEDLGYQQPGLYAVTGLEYRLF